MKIIVTDGYVENPGDLSWAPLEALGEVTYYDRIGLTDEDETIRRIGDAEIAVINKAPVTRKVIDICPNLKLITVLATGYNVVDVAYAKENPKVKGKTSLDRLLREGKELKIIALQSKDVGQFKELAKQYGVLFAVIKDKAQNEKVDVMFKAEDVAKLNRIYEQLGYAIPKVTTADRKKDPTRRQSGDSLLTRGKNPLDIDPRPSVRATIMALKNAAQKAEQAQEKVQDITAKEER